MRNELLKVIMTMVIIYNLVKILYKIIYLKLGEVGGIFYLLLVFIIGFFIHLEKFSERDK